MVDFSHAMHPAVFIAMAVFIFLWVLNEKINYDACLRHPEWDNNYCLLPRRVVDRLSVEFTFLLSRGVLSLVLTVFIHYRVDVRVLLTWCWILAAMDVSDWLALRAEDREMKG